MLVAQPGPMSRSPMKTQPTSSIYPRCCLRSHITSLQSSSPIHSFTQLLWEPNPASHSPWKPWHPRNEASAEDPRRRWISVSFTCAWCAKSWQKVTPEAVNNRNPWFFGRPSVRVQLKTLPVFLAISKHFGLPYCTFIPPSLDQRSSYFLYSTESQYTHS